MGGVKRAVSLRSRCVMHKQTRLHTFFLKRASLRNVLAADQAPPHLVGICKSGKHPRKANNGVWRIPVPRESAHSHRHMATSQVATRRSQGRKLNIMKHQEKHQNIGVNITVMARKSSKLNNLLLGKYLQI